MQPAELKLATCLQVVLNAGYSITKENWDDMLEVSGVAAVRSQYWDLYNARKDQLMARDFKNLNVNYLSNPIFSAEQRQAIRPLTEGIELLKLKVASPLPLKAPQIPKISEESIVSAIPDELTVVL